MAAVKRVSQGTRRKAGRRPAGSQPVTEVLYDRVTGRSQEVVVLPTTAPASRVTVRLGAEQRAKIDRVARRMAQTTGRAVSRTAIIRGALDALLSIDLDLAGCRNEADVKAAVLGRLTRRR